MTEKEEILEHLLKNSRIIHSTMFVKKIYKTQGKDGLYVNVLYNDTCDHGSVFLTKKPIRQETSKAFFKRLIPSSLHKAFDKMSDSEIYSMSYVRMDNNMFYGFESSDYSMAQFNYSLTTGNCGAILIRDVSFMSLPEEHVESFFDAMYRVCSENNRNLVMTSDRVNGQVDFMTDHTLFRNNFSEYSVSTGVKNSNSGNNIFTLSFCLNNRQTFDLSHKKQKDNARKERKPKLEHNSI